MKEIEGKISILVGREETTIEFRDAKAGITFAVAKLTPKQLSMALSRLGNTPCDIVVRGLDKVGKVQEINRLSVEMPPDTRYGRDRVEIATKLAKEQCPEGWEPDYYFRSQDSFSTKDGKDYAKCTIRRWVEGEG